jgi:GNAT superfamily N-acetyltransferase
MPGQNKPGYHWPPPFQPQSKPQPPATAQRQTAGADAGYNLLPPLRTASGRQQIRVAPVGSPQTVGSVEFAPGRGGAVHISNLSVAPQHRRQGLATKLVGAALASARSQGFVEASLEAHPDDGNISRAALVSMYQKLGFRMTGLSQRGNPLMQSRPGLPTAAQRKMAPPRAVAPSAVLMHGRSVLQPAPDPTRTVASAQMQRAFAAVQKSMAPSSIVSGPMPGPAGIQRAIQRMEKREKKEKRRGGRSTEKKSGSKSQRDKKPFPMSDPEYGELFTQFWHGLKQKSNGKLPDWQDSKWLDLKQSEINPHAQSNDPAWSTKTIQELFNEWLLAKGFGKEASDDEEFVQHRNYDLPPDDPGGYDVYG